MSMGGNNVASQQQVTALDVDVASTEVNTGKEDDKDNIRAEESCHIAEVNAKESTQRVTEAISSDELVAKQEDKIESENVGVNDEIAYILSEHKELFGIEEASENLYLELDPHARMSEDVNERIVEEQKFEETLSSTILKLDTKENQVNEMYKEVESLRMSESRRQKDLLETTSFLSSKKNDLQLKVLEFEEMREKLAVKESTEALVRSSLQKELDKSQLLEAVVAELTEKLKLMQDKCNDVESELEQKLKYLQEESLEAQDSTAQKNLEQKIMEHNMDVLELSMKLEALKTGKEQMSFEAQDLKCQISELELALNQSSREKSQLEAKLENFFERCAEHESRARASLERNLELEDLVLELESLLETKKNKINDLEQEKETRSKEYSDMVFALSTQLENAVQAGAEKEKGLEIDNEQMNYRVQELTVKMSELESTLSQTLALKCELESQVKELSDRCVVDESRANLINKRNLELEELVRELEFQLGSGRSRINYLEQELDNLEQKSVEYYDMVSTLTTQLQSASTATKDTREKLQESEWKLEEAEFKNLELKDQLTFLKLNYDDAERKLKEQMNCQVEELRAKITQVEEINVEHERRADVAQEHILELEDLASEIELLLETKKNRIRDLEQEVEILEKKYGHAEAKSKEHVDMVSALTVEVENEKQLVESLNMIIEEKRNSEEHVHDSEDKLQEVENLLQVQHIELLATQGKLEMARIKEIEITKKLESAQVQLQEQGRSLEDATIKTIELESLNDTLINDTGLQLQELAENLKNKEIEVNSLNEKLHNLEHQIQCYVEEAAVMAKALTEELNHTNSLVETNINMTNKVGELQQLLDLANVDKQAVASTITEQQETEARFLQETITHKESEVKELSYKCSNLEEQLKIHESRKIDLDCCLVKLQDQTKVIQGLEAKMTQLEMQTGALIEENMNLNGEFAESQTKLNDLQEKLSSTLVEKDSVVQTFKASMKVVDDLKQELSSERQSLQSRIYSIMEEKQLLCEAGRVAQGEMQTINNELEGQLKEYKESNGALKAELENLKLQATQNSALQSRVKQLNEQLGVNDSQFKQEIATIMEEKQLLREESTEAQNEVLILMSQLEEQLSKYKESNEALKAELEKVMFKSSRDSGMQTRGKEVEQLLEVQNVFESASRLDGDAPSEKELKNDGDGKKRKSPKNAEAHFPVNNIKIALRVALVSVVTAILVGKN